MLEQRARAVMASLQADHGGAIQAGAVIEALLGERLGATGLGLGTRMREVEHRLPAEMVSRLRLVTAVRNSMAHDPLAQVHKPEQFVRAARDVIEALLVWQEPPPPQPRNDASASAARGMAPRPGILSGLPQLLAIALVAALGAAFFVHEQRATREAAALAPAATRAPSRQPGAAVQPVVLQPAPAAAAIAAAPVPVATSALTPAQPEPSPSPVARHQRPASNSATGHVNVDTRMPAAGDAPSVGADDLSLEQLRAIKGRLQ